MQSFLVGIIKTHKRRPRRLQDVKRSQDMYAKRSGRNKRTETAFRER